MHATVVTEREKGAMEAKYATTGFTMPTGAEHLQGAMAKATVVPPGHTMVYTTGLLGWNDKGECEWPHDTEAQCRQIFKTLERTLAEVGGTLDDVVMITVFLRSMDDIMDTMKVRQETWPGTPPSSCTVAVAEVGLDERDRLEITTVAAIPPR